MLLYVGLTQFVRQRRLLANAERVDAVVVHSDYESDLMYPNIIVRTHASCESAADALAPFPLGGSVRAYVDPSLPDKAYLIAEAGAGPMVFIIVGLLLPPLAWFVGKYF